MQLRIVCTDCAELPGNALPDLVYEGDRLDENPLLGDRMRRNGENA